VAVVHLGLDGASLEAELRAVVERVRGERRARLAAALAGTHRGLGDLENGSPAMQRLVALARRVARTDTTVLLLGETGSGKEWLARAMHEDGPRRDGPFIAVNCGAIPEPLLESELFGHEEGAFSGARRAHRGHFELAHGGTLFLDEIAEMPPHVQVRLLRALQEQKIRRVGGEREITVDARIMAATNRDLDREMQAGRFRPDLYYRLGVMTLTVPPLRERREDIAEILHRQLERLRARMGHGIRGVTPEAWRALHEYAWPGNVRELVNVVERAILLASGDEIGLEELPGIGPAAAAGVPAPPDDTAAGHVSPDDVPAAPLREARDEMVSRFEREYLDRTLRAAGGRIGLSARRAGISERALFEKMRRYGLRKEDYRE
jgi:DNA-binding NtrC family response regulator